REALQEVANIGMGQAGASIAKVLGEFVELSVPQISACLSAATSSVSARLSSARRTTSTRVSGEKGLGMKS
ncbi:MAG: chemotaxis protein CheC, partial [Burkholderiales bacterium]|nr:chemotaxis protein CheC [Burkholderiales bacterium]